MRYFKDSSALMNPREYYWNEQYINQKRYLLRALSGHNLQKFNLLDIFQRNVLAFFYHWNRLMDGTHVYLPKSKRLALSPHWWIFGLGFFLGCFLHAFELRLWKERKWDQEPGCMIPCRKPFYRRVINYYINMKWITFLYYHGYLINYKDFTTVVDVEHIVQGRKYRRTLALEYVYKEKRISMRDDRYDFLELSPKHGIIIS